MILLPRFAVAERSSFATIGAGLLSAPCGLDSSPWRRPIVARQEPISASSTAVIPSVENHRDVIRPVSYFHKVAMPKAAAIAPIPIRMFQFPKALIRGTDGPAT